MRELFLFLVAILTCIPNGPAQTPELFNYQAIARYSDGTPIQNRTIGIRISILEGSAVGMLIYREVHEVTTNEFGLVTLAIGNGSSDQDFTKIGWHSGGNKWIQVELDIENYGEFILMGTTPLLSVPYALFAKQSESAPSVLLSLTDTERKALPDPADGLIIYNTTTNSLNIHRNGEWWEIGMTKISQTWQCGDPLIDTRDERSYKTVLIGNKCWMAENLNVGQAVNLSSGQTDNGIIEKFYYNNNDQFGPTYGGLYTWSEVMNYTTVKGSQGICPTGWHIPTDQEWQEMEMAIGMSFSEAEKGNTWRGIDQGTKLGPGGSSGYNALYSGRAVPGLGFTAMGSYEYIWTSNESSDNAWRRCLESSSTQVGRYDTFPKSYGMSVRCIK